LTDGHQLEPEANGLDPFPIAACPADHLPQISHGSSGAVNWSSHGGSHWWAIPSEEFTEESSQSSFDFLVLICLDSLIKLFLPRGAVEYATQGKHVWPAITSDIDVAVRT